MKPTGGWPWLNLQSLSSVMTPFHSGALAEVPSMPQPHLHGKEQGVTCHTLQHTTHRLRLTCNRFLRTTWSRI